MVIHHYHNESVSCLSLLSICLIIIFMAFIEPFWYSYVRLWSVFIIFLCLVDVLLFNYSIVLLLSRAPALPLSSPYSRGSWGHTSHSSTILVLEIYGMVGRVNMSFAIGSTLTIIMKQLEFPIILIIVYTDSYSLYECLVKFGITKKKRFIIDIMAIRESYENRELFEIR
jgi:hypothetical protein